MKAHIHQVTTLTRIVEVDVDDDVPFTPQAAIAVAKALKSFDRAPLTSAVTYEVHDNAPGGCTVAQVAGRAATVDVAAADAQEGE